MFPIPRVFASFLLFVFLVGLTACRNNSPAQSQVAASAVATPDLLQATPPAVPPKELAMGLTSTSVANTTASVAAATIEAALRATPTTTSDLAATQTAQANQLATSGAATIPARFTRTPDLAATATKRAQQLATVIMATLTNQPTATPTLTATSTTENRQMGTAVAATLTAIARATPLSDHTATINTVTLNLRTGPGTIYSVIKSYRQGTVVSVMGKEPGGQWLIVKTPDGESGWMATRFLLLSTDFSNIPTVETPPTPTPTN